jgi:hypothetical protein
LESSKFPKLKRNNIYTRSETHSRGVHRDEAKVEAFWKFEILPSIGRKCGIPGGAVVAIRSTGKEIWTIGYYVQEELRRSLQKEGTDSRRILTRNPVSRWIGRRCSEFSLWSKHTRIKGSGLSDLEQVPENRQIGQEIHKA